MINREIVLEDILSIAKKYYADICCDPDRWFKHALHVRDLSLRIFDDKRELGLHEMSGKERFWLEAAAILHDVGRSKDQDKHHVYSREIILESRRLEEEIGSESLNIIAWIAFFHRRKPDPRKHDDQDWQRILNSKGLVLLMLISILRIADALDRTTSQVVEDVKTQLSNDKIVFKLKTRGNASIEINRAYMKSKLFKQVFKKDILVTE